jgi:hypothetical protein
LAGKTGPRDELGAHRSIEAGIVFAPFSAGARRAANPDKSNFVETARATNRPINKIESAIILI